MKESANSVTILLVDDQRPVRECLAEILTRDGYNVITAQDGEAALAQARGSTTLVDLLISDIEMPGMSGIELADTLTRERPSIRVLIMSAGDVDTHDLQSRWSFVAKPILDLGYFRAVVASLCRRRPPGRESGPEPGEKFGGGA